MESDRTQVLKETFLKLGVDGSNASALAGTFDSLMDLANLEFGQTMHAADLEERAVEAAMRAVRPLLESKLQQEINRIDAETIGDSWCCGCGQIAQSHGRRTRPWMSLTGEIQLCRRYAYCETCKQGHSRAQQALGLTDSQYTPRMEEVCTLMATTVPHGMAIDLVKKMVGAEVSARGIQQMTERRAQRVEAELQQDAIKFAPYDQEGLPVVRQQRPSDAVKTVAEVAYLEMDGVVPMTREELTGEELSAEDRRKQRRAKKQGARGGRGRRYRLVGKEVKNAVLYTSEDCAQESVSRGCIMKKQYVSYLGDWERFALLLWVQLLRQGFDRAKKLVVLSDGAEWIRSLCGWLPIPVLLILDLFHVKKRIWDVANSLYGEHSKKARAWAEKQCSRVEAGAAKDVIESLRFVQSKHPKTRKAVDDLAQYLDNNLDRMNYPAYKAMALRVGSGTVESANYHVTGARLKLQGMRWSEQGAREMAYLRADLFNQNWEARTRVLWAA